ncbi:peptidoglycan editing factor PgeF [Shewanella donghaensis]|uniref:peptidoglycan editing factor PgeF n=1 Tax=Shewanella donghaensis TaxID=238836 RepID=UPI001181E393|nr:peptidoglycan editing factor PgeF [Shewanella donghaensis]
MFKANWPLPDNVAIAMTDSHGGVSHPPYNSLNLGLHVGDATEDVLANRALLQKTLSIPSPLVWLEQVHGTKIIDCSTLTSSDLISPLTADGSYSNSCASTLVVMTADCLPVLLCNKVGTEVAAIHAGWRGLCDGVIEAAIEQFQSPASDILAFLGPAIGPNAFEVGTDVYQSFTQQHAQAKDYFTSFGEKYLADLAGLAQMRLSLKGVKSIHDAKTCTFSDTDYFSYRRDQQTGRMASLIWLKS